MNAVGIDVSKGKSMIAVMRPLGEVVAAPFEIAHTADELKKLVTFLKALTEETRVVMEYTGRYFLPIARSLCEAGIHVSMINALLIHGYASNSLRRGKTDKKDAIKLANYALDQWHHLVPYVPAQDTRQVLQTLNRQYGQYTKVKVMLKNNLIALLDQSFPGANTLFSSPPREDGHEKWVDFALAFWHCECVSSLSVKVFTERYRKWCQRAGYHFDAAKAQTLHAFARNCVAVFPKDDSTHLLISLAIRRLTDVAQSLAAITAQMQTIAASLPEYPVVMSLYGVGKNLGPRLMAEIGDVRRFYSKKALVAFAGLDSPPFQSGSFEARSRSISKRGSASLRNTLFLVMSIILRTANPDEPVFIFLDKKRSEGKHYLVYMMAAANKFLRIYYAKVNGYLQTLDAAA